VALGQASLSSPLPTRSGSRASFPRNSLTEILISKARFVVDVVRKDCQIGTTQRHWSHNLPFPRLYTSSSGDNRESCDDLNGSQNIRYSPADQCTLDTLPKAK